jgi:hypothetical protein
VKELPKIGGKLQAPHRMRVPRKCTERCYLNRVLPALLKKHVSHRIVAVFCTNFIHLCQYSMKFRIFTHYAQYLRLFLRLFKISDSLILSTKISVFHFMQVIRLTKFDYRLANRLQTDLQKLRCRVNYHALRFTAPIQEMGEKLIQRMRERSKHFIALHLRWAIKFCLGHIYHFLFILFERKMCLMQITQFLTFLMSADLETH